MDKLKMHSLNKVEDNVKKIKELFPNCVTERKNKDGETVLGVDFEMLKQELSSVVIDKNEERYQFTWPDKKQAILAANAPIAKTLRPCREESVDFDKTENLYIEGDNLDVLKLLQETYLGKIKMIYIDPPYNTGNDFVYEDDFSEDAADYIAHSGQLDDQGNRLFSNTESNGRFHTDWLNMMYPRLKLAKDLLTDDGVIFISIDDNEIDNLKKITNDVFGEQNFVSNIIWKKKYGIQNDAQYFSSNHDYILAYAKNISNYKQNLLPRTEEQNSRYKNPDNDPRGPWKAGDMSVGRYTPRDCYEVITPSGRSVYPPSGNSWRLSKETFEAYLADNRIWFGVDGNNVPSIKRFLSEVKDGTTSSTIWEYDEVGHTDKAKKDLKELFDGASYFDYPKPIALIKKMLVLATDKNSIILDFFSGSATTAHAVMQLNAEDGGNRKFIMVQLPEKTDEKSEAYKAGYKNICEIGKERIRRAGEKIKKDIDVAHSDDQKKLIESQNSDTQLKMSGYSTLRTLGDVTEKTYYYQNRETGEITSETFKKTENIYRFHPEKLDTGFRVLKLDSSNLEDVYYYPSEVGQISWDSLTENIKADRTPEDLLFQVMLDLGVFLSEKIEETTINGRKVFKIAGNYLIACFDKNVDDKTITEIAKQKPYYFVMRDSSMANDSVATNFDQIFKTYSPETTRKVL